MVLRTESREASSARHAAAVATIMTVNFSLGQDWVSRMTNAAEPLSDAEVECLDPGIRDLVVMLRAAGFETTDSGDGVSKPAGERVFDYPHVYAVASSPHRLLYEAHRLQELLGDKWMVEAVYMPRNGMALLAASKCDPALLWEGTLRAQGIPAVVRTADIQKSGS